MMAIRALESDFVIGARNAIGREPAQICQSYGRDDKVKTLC